MCVVGNVVPLCCREISQQSLRRAVDFQLKLSVWLSVQSDGLVLRPH